MAATATPTKPKAPKAIVTTKVTADGVQTVLAKSAQDQLDRTRELIELLRKVPSFSDAAVKAAEALDELAEVTRPTAND